MNEYIDCHIDNDFLKLNTTIGVFNKQIDMELPTYLNECDENTVIFINISRSN